MNTFKFTVTVKTEQKNPHKIQKALWDILNKLRKYGVIDEWECKKDIEDSVVKDSSHDSPTPFRFGMSRESKYYG